MVIILFFIGAWSNLQIIRTDVKSWSSHFALTSLVLEGLISPLLCPPALKKLREHFALVLFEAASLSKKQSFLYVTQCLNLIYIAIKIHYHIPKGYLVMGCAKNSLKNNQRDIIPNLSKGKLPFLRDTLS